MVPVIRISQGVWISGYALHLTDLKASLVEVGVREVRMRLVHMMVHPNPIRICMSGRLGAEQTQRWKATTLKKRVNRINRQF